MSANDLQPWLTMPIGALGMYLIYRLSANHIESNTRAIGELRMVMERILDKMGTDTK